MRYCRETAILNQPRRGGQKIARGERSETLERVGIKESPEGATENIDIKRPVAPCGALYYQTSYQGFAALTPGYFLIAPSGLC